MLLLKQTHSYWSRWFSNPSYKLLFCLDWFSEKLEILMEKKKSCSWVWSVFYYLSLFELPSTCMNNRAFIQQPVFVGDLSWSTSKVIILQNSSGIIREHKVLLKLFLCSTITLRVLSSLNCYDVAYRVSMFLTDLPPQQIFLNRSSLGANCEVKHLCLKTFLILNCILHLMWRFLLNGTSWSCFSFTFTDVTLSKKASFRKLISRDC